MKKGHWVRNKRNGHIGLVESYDMNYNKTYVLWKFNRKHEQLAVVSRSWEAEHNLEYAPLSLTKEDYYALANLAVNTGDRQWFDILIGRAEGVK